MNLSVRLFEAEGRKPGRVVRKRTAGSFDDDHTTCCCTAERLGLAGKSQPPALLHVVWQWPSPGAGIYQTGVIALIRLVSTKAFPGETLDRKSIEKVVTAVVSPVRYIGPHRINSPAWCV
jgi:hypothetical protein